MDWGLLRELAGLTDPAGVLSVYVTVDPAAPAAAPAAAIRLRDELHGLLAGIDAPERRAAVQRRVTALQPRLAELLDPANAGVGRVLFAPVSRDESRLLAFQLPVPDLAVCRPAAYLLPLVGVVEASAPAGVAVLSRDGVRLLQWTPGRGEPVDTIRFEPRIADWRELKGPPPANPALAQKAASQRDHFEHRLEALLARFLHDAAHQVAHEAGRRGWDELVVAGDSRQAEPFAAGIREHRRGLAILRSPQLLSAATPAQIAAAVGADLLVHRRAAAAALARQARSTALAGGPGAYGLADTLGALAEGRVARLVLDRAGQWQGSRAPDGRLLPAGEILPGVPAEQLVPEPQLAERMVEQAVAGGAEVIVVDGPAAEPLAPAGVAAVLRW